MVPQFTAPDDICFELTALIEGSGIRSIFPKRTAYPKTPSSKITVAVVNADEKEFVRYTMYPVTIGAEIAESCPPKFVIPPIVARLSRGAINDGTVQATGAAAAKPPKARLIHISAAKGE